MVTSSFTVQYLQIYIEGNTGIMTRGQVLSLSTVPFTTSLCLRWVTLIVDGRTDHNKPTYICSFLKKEPA